MKQAKVSVRAGRACFYLRKPYLAYCTPMYMEAETVSPFVPGDSRRLLRYDSQRNQGDSPLPVKHIRPTYRAQFQQPLGALNPLGVKLSSPIDVELFEEKAKSWRARRPGTKSLFDIPAHADLDTLRDQMTPQYFASQLTQWRVFYNGQMLQHCDYRTATDGRVYLYEPEDFTHIGHPEGGGTDRKKGLAACGGMFAYDKFASTVQGSPPSCAVCRVAYNQMVAIGA
jgi:hypothetical protein